jgi:hypothetical protein
MVTTGIASRSSAAATMPYRRRSSIRQNVLTRGIPSAGRWPLAALALLLLTGCSAADRSARATLAELAGPGATDCGRGTTMGGLPKVNACALEAQREGKPFFMRYLTHGTDSLVTYGVARNAHGKLFKITIDHDPNGGRRDPFFRSRGTVSVQECVARVVVPHRAMLTCDP